MGKDNRSRKQAKNKQNMAPDGRDVEFSQELADSEDLQAQERAKAAERRARRK
ncbi:YfhD family protein [Pseudalkalibacillus berkeleyi]|uniref:YfhD family protein n=1 Tax=Pseudalkalibacillus berkeleyi TaxID=1069813 RepID=A0ABS9H5S8_9BACL|nr:YfhD family protein [Pseudalkalibacillus berkeleyi]MCF6139304.1 YfhD family protein [Pseudalkalibacillus berkeleyi]